MSLRNLIHPPRQPKRERPSVEEPTSEQLKGAAGEGRDEIERRRPKKRKAYSVNSSIEAQKGAVAGYRPRHTEGEGETEDHGKGAMGRTGGGVGSSGERSVGRDANGNVRLGEVDDANNLEDVLPELLSAEERKSLASLPCSRSMFPGVSSPNHRSGMFLFT